MKTRLPESCKRCGAILHPKGPDQWASTTVLENDKEIILLHCPRCATLQIEVRRTLAHAR